MAGVRHGCRQCRQFCRLCRLWQVSGTGVVNVVDFVDFVDFGRCQARVSLMLSTLSTLAGVRHGCRRLWRLQTGFVDLNLHKVGFSTVEYHSDCILDRRYSPSRGTTGRQIPRLGLWISPFSSRHLKWSESDPLSMSSDFWMEENSKSGSGREAGEYNTRHLHPTIGYMLWPSLQINIVNGNSSGF